MKNKHFKNFQRLPSLTATGETYLKDSSQNHIKWNLNMFQVLHYMYILQQSQIFYVEYICFQIADKDYYYITHTCISYLFFLFMEQALLGLLSKWPERNFEDNK